METENHKEIPRFGEKMKMFASQVEGLAGALEKFVEDNFIEKEQREQNLKKLTKTVESFFKEKNKAEASEHSRVRVKIKKWDHYKGALPKYETLHSSGFDVRAQMEDSIDMVPGQRLLIPTGLSFEIPPGYEIQARPRSGWAVKKGVSMVNTPGTIDADYRGEVKIILINHGQETVQINDQDRIAQLVLCPIVQADFTVVDELDETDRGEGGFGSTGK